MCTEDKEDCKFYTSDTYGGEVSLKILNVPKATGAEINFAPYRSPAKQVTLPNALYSVQTMPATVLLIKKSASITNQLNILVCTTMNMFRTMRKIITMPMIVLRVIVAKMMHIVQNTHFGSTIGPTFWVFVWVYVLGC